MEKGKKIFYFVILLIVVLLIGVFYNPWVKVAFRTFLLSTEVNPNFPLRPLKLYKNTVEKNLEVDTKIGKVKIDIYKPNAKPPFPAVLLTLGTIVSKEDEGLVRFANALSKTGVVVMTADLPDLTAGYIFTESIDATADLFKYLESQDYVDKKALGMGGFCGGASVVIVAGAQESIKDKVNYLVAVSPYFSALNYSRAALTGDIKGSARKWQTGQVIRKSFVWGYTAYIDDNVLRDKIRADLLGGAVIDEAQLNEIDGETRAIYLFLKNSEPGKFDDLYSQIPRGGKKIISDISPESSIKNLKSKLFLLNDGKDTFVPKEETLRLREVLDKRQSVYAQVDSFEHVRPGIRLRRWEGVKQAFKLYVFLYQVFLQIYR